MPISDEFSSMLESRRDWRSCSKLIHAGLPASFFDELGLLIGLTPPALGRLLNVKPSTRRRWVKAGLLNTSESEYLFRKAVVLHAALGMFEGNAPAMREWLERPSLAFNQMAPVELLSTFVGIDLVEAYIWRIEHGVAV